MTQPGESGQYRNAGEAAAAASIVVLARELAIELHPRLRSALKVSIDSDLDRDLGLDSLGRAELLLRLERAFNVRLDPSLIGEAATLRQLLASVLEAGPETRTYSETAASEGTSLPSVEAPGEARTLIEALGAHVMERAQRPHIHLWHGEAGAETITYAALDAGARRVAAGLIERRLEIGERVAIMLPTQAEFFYAFLGVLYAGGVPVPIYPPFRRAQIEDHLRRQAGILRNARASMLITGEEIRQVGQLLFGLADTLRSVETVATLSSDETLQAPVPAAGDTIALIQYTSGSTGDPKGVVLTHANLLANIRAMGEALAASSSDVFVSWLPLYHDMGLIGAWLGCLYYAAPTTLMPPLAFLADPARWLWAVHRQRATLTAAPNFAYELCVKNVRDEDIKGLDLSSLRMMLNGAEPVSPSTMRRFGERFRAFGLDPRVLAPVYGLAECSVGLAFPPPGRGLVVDHVDRDALTREGIARRQAAGIGEVLEIVACGRPIPRHEVRIVDDAGREVPDRHEGRLQFKGPSATSGYFRDQRKTAALFDGEWLESGDRAYVAGGDVHIVGRIKDIIIRAGRHIYPQEIEELVGEIEGVRKGCVAAFPASDSRGGTERLVVMAETRLTEAHALEELRSRIIEAATGLYNTPPDDVLLVPPHTVPKTSSGKIRRASARERYEAHALGHGGRSLQWQLARLAVMGVGRRLRRAGRMAAGVAYAGWWWIALIATAAIAWAIVMVLPMRAWRHMVVHQMASLFFSLTGARIAIDRDAGAEIPSQGAVLVSNHASYLDAAVICACVPGELSFVAKAELADQWIAGPFLKRLGSLFARRLDAKGAVEDTEEQVKAAAAGARIVSFPEGTLTRMPGLLGFHLGAFVVAAETGRPVVPITLRGTRSILRGNQWFPRRGNIDVHIAAPVEARGSGFEAAVRLRDAVRGQILAEAREPDLEREVVRLEPTTNRTR